VSTDASDRAGAARAWSGQQVSSLVRAWRERALLTQEQLAERTGLSVRTIRRLESGHGSGRPQGTSIRLLARALELSPAEQAALAAAARGAPPDGGPRGGGPATPAAGPQPPRQLPAPPPVFTGRAAELADLARVRDASAVVITAIDGMAGVGKTALAVQAAHGLAEHYPDGQLFVDLHGYTEGVPPVDPGDALDRMLRVLGVPGEGIPHHLDDRAALYRSRLADRKVLVLLDNAAEEAQVAPLLPGTPGCLVLVTSRRRLAGLDHTQTLSLDVLPPRDAIALFVRTVGEGRLGGEAHDLLAEAVELCGRLPLMIRIAGARLRSHPTWSAAHLVERLRDGRHRLAELQAGQRSITAALDLSYQQLPSEQQRAYRLVSLHPGAEFGAPAAAALTATSETQSRRILDRLCDAHLLQEPAPGRYRFHDLVRAHAATTSRRSDAEPDRRAATARLLDHYCHTASVAMDTAYPYERDRRPRTPGAATSSPAPVLDDAAEAIAWLDLELPNLVAVARHAADHGRPDGTLHLSATLHRHLRGRGRYAVAAALHQHALAIARSSGNRAAEQHALTSIGHISRLQGRNQQAVEQYTRAMAVDHPGGEVWPLLGLGHAHRLQGRFASAADCFERAREIARATGHRGAELDASTGLGWLHRQQGHHGQAIEAFERAREIARDTGNRSGELDALTGLGWLHRQQGDHAAAVTHFEQALDISRAIGNRHGELNAMTGLGSAYRLQDRHEQAAEVYRRTLLLAREIGNRNLQFEALHGMGRLRCAAGQPDDALTCHRQALDLATELGQPGDQARSHDGLAHAHHALEHHDLARRHWQHALDILIALGAAGTEDGETTAERLRGHLGTADR
jgi:tetratricopeptide (TPR) repeat protein/DNA-binding XRE family transcriptional regulator